jgi:hypothetical protein
MRVPTVLISFVLIIGVAFLCFAYAQDTAQQGILYGVYDGSWGLRYYIKGDALYDTSWELQFYIRENILYDKHWQRRGIIKGSDIYDENLYLRYRIKEWKLPEKPEP